MSNHVDEEWGEQSRKSQVNVSLQLVIFTLPPNELNVILWSVARYILMKWLVVLEVGLFMLTRLIWLTIEEDATKEYSKGEKTLCPRFMGYDLVYGCWLEVHGKKYAKVEGEYPV